MGISIDLTGKKFNKLTVLEKTDKRQFSNVIWKCKCKCGNITYVTSRNLTTAHTKSCGCLAKELASKRLKSRAFIEKYKN